MKAFCITIKDNAYSEEVSNRCRVYARQYGLDVERWDAVHVRNAYDVMESLNLKWTWANNNTSPAVCPFTGLKQHPYKTLDLRARIGCAMSHYMLWRKCTQLDEPILILEHDAIFIRPLPKIDSVHSAIMINDPTGATPKGAWWAEQIAKKGPGIHWKTEVFKDEELRPDGLAGNSAYIISPKCAATLMDAYHRLGVWPNDATLCRQIVPHLQELYPFVTKVEQKQSTSGGY